jgi:uncharacterized protein
VIKLETKSFPFECKSIDDNTFEAYASVFGNVDSYSDVCESGCFTKSIKERTGQIKVLFNHNPQLPIGVPIEMHEDSKGLYVKAKISQTTTGKDVLTLMRDGVISEMSIGYSTIKDEWDQKNQVRRLKELKLYEVSPVTFPANEQARILNVKSMQSIDQLWNYLDVIYEMQKEVKAGRVLSEKNTILVKQAHDALGALLDTVEPSDDTPNSKEAAINITVKSSNHSTDDEAVQAILKDMRKYVGSV